MKATITVVIEGLEDWDQFDNFTVPQMKKDLTEFFEDEALMHIGYESVKVEIE